ncbi:Protein kinase-like domain [Pseudocohnilembus persalinus]|uniref:Protein kinase-like domain n=1 Tax=Pseudocohnilembus persalinus TaxID=266149 RepID=A0A0V0QLM3_PSEPJ|nr:Protein kinase-like domain [Pseudocohnilembus persalinus]|eukprot:KRX02961.1 Protein kinase-like domain [Pseudocohnilembus persalinus]
MAFDENNKTVLVQKFPKYYIQQKIPESKEQYKKIISLQTLLQNESFIPKILDAFLYSKNNYYIIIEYSQDFTLGSFIAKNGIISEKKAKLYITQIYESYDMLKKKSQNDILFDMCINQILKQNQQLIINDFGFQKILNKVANKNKKQINFILSEAPEVLHNPQNYKPEKSDVWSLGIMLYQMLFSNNSFSQQDKKQELQFNMKNNSISEECQNLLHEMLRSNPNDKISWNKLKSHTKRNLSLQLKQNRSQFNTSQQSDYSEQNEVDSIQNPQDSYKIWSPQSSEILKNKYFLKCEQNKCQLFPQQMEQNCKQQILNQSI